MENGKTPRDMLKEIREESAAMRATLTNVASTCRKIAGELGGEGAGLAYFSGSGTSYHVALAGEYAVSSLCVRPAKAIPSSELESWVRTALSRKNVLVTVSQSGESVDILSAVKTARERGIRTIAITNTRGSTLADSADFTVLTRAGPEKAITATKTYHACLAAEYLLVFELAGATKEHACRPEGLAELRQQLLDSPDAVQKTLEGCDGQARALAERFKHDAVIFLLGRGANTVTALEGALKLKEACNIMAEGHAAREFLHGPMQLITRNTPIMMISTREGREELEPIVKNFRQLGAPIAWISENHEASNGEEQVSVAGTLPELLSPLTFAVPIQLFAYYSSIARGLNPDRPTKLSKVVK